MTTAEFTMSGRGEVIVRVSDAAPEDVFTRMAEGDLPRSLYGPMNQSRVLEHWTYNALRNGVTDVSSLDGWADIERGLVTLDVVNVDDFDFEKVEAIG